MEERKKYVEVERTKLRARSKSTNDMLTPRWKRDVDEWDELDIDLMDAFRHGFQPYTDDLFSP